MHVCIYPIYIHSYHWILLILSVETDNLIVFDSMRNPKSAIQHIIDPFEQVSSVCTIKSFFC